MADERIVVAIEATVPNKELFQKFIQHIRDFDVAHSDQCHFEMAADTKHLRTEEVQEILASIFPPFKYNKFIPIQDMGKS